MNEYPSLYLEKAVQALSRFPGLGKRSAARLSLWLLKQDAKTVVEIGQAILDLREVRYCDRCHNISDAPICGLCSNPLRDPHLLCVVSDVRDVMAIESCGVFKGLYHVLGGVISPIEGISPGELYIESLLQRIENEPIQEVIFALPSTLDGDTTQFYIQRRLGSRSIRLSTVARGIAVGDDLEYTDELTLGRSIENRVVLQDLPKRAE